MSIPTTVSFRNMGHSDRIEIEVLNRIEKLSRIFEGIIACRVVIELPHKHHRKGNLFLLKIDLRLPDKEIIVNRESVESLESENFQIVLSDAFDAAKKQLREYADRKHRKVKHHDVLKPEPKSSEE